MENKTLTLSHIIALHYNINRSVGFLTKFAPTHTYNNKRNTQKEMNGSQKKKDEEMRMALASSTILQTMYIYILYAAGYEKSLGY